MGPTRVNIPISVSFLFFFSSLLINVYSSPIASLNSEYSSSRIYMRDPRTDNPTFRGGNYYQNDPLIFESSDELDWDGGGGGRGRTTHAGIRGYALGVSPKMASTTEEISADRIDFFQPIRPRPTTTRQQYNRRPTSRKVSNGLQSRFQASSELWSSVKNNGECDSQVPQIVFNDKIPSSSPAESILPPHREEIIQSDTTSSSSGQDDSNNDDEDDLFNMFFAHVKSTPVSTSRKTQPPTRHTPENVEVDQVERKKYKGKLLEKPAKYTYPLDNKRGKKKKTKNPQDEIKNIVFESDSDGSSSSGGDEDSDELAFLTFDSGIQRRKCGSDSSVKDGKCRPPSNIQ